MPYLFVMNVDDCACLLRLHLYQRQTAVCSITVLPDRRHLTSEFSWRNSAASASLMPSVSEGFFDGLTVVLS